MFTKEYIVYRAVNKAGGSMEVASVRLTKEEKKFLEELVIKGKYSSISEALKAGIYELMQEERLAKLPWKTRSEVRRYFAKKERKLQGLEEIHDEDD
ncbi:MAG: ribbon-helix-helix domain-containing protein [Candidatus Heimdallarchaeota archaeon]|nr:ribbon-helix-helix domain-containing protein [Candidatus Heimdallarchaeota archaeon]